MSHRCALPIHRQHDGPLSASRSLGRATFFLSRARAHTRGDDQSRGLAPFPSLRLLCTYEYILPCSFLPMGVIRLWAALEKPRLIRSKRPRDPNMGSASRTRPDDPARSSGPVGCVPSHVVPSPFGVAVIGEGGTGGLLMMLLLGDMTKDGVHECSPWSPRIQARLHFLLPRSPPGRDAGLGAAPRKG